MVSEAEQTRKSAHASPVSCPYCSMDWTYLHPNWGASHLFSNYCAEFMRGCTERSWGQSQLKPQLFKFRMLTYH